MVNVAEQNRPISSTLEVMGKGGVQTEHFDRLRSDQNYAGAVFRSMSHGGFTAENGYAPEFGGVPLSRFFGPREWEFFFNIGLPASEHEMAKSFPWSELENSLYERGLWLYLHDTHFAYYVPRVMTVGQYRREDGGFRVEGIPAVKPLTLEVIEKTVVGMTAHWRRPKLVYQDELFADILDEVVAPGWHLVARDVVLFDPADYQETSLVEWVLAQVLCKQKYTLPMNDASAEPHLFCRPKEINGFRPTTQWTFDGDAIMLALGPPVATPHLRVLSRKLPGPA